MNHFCTLFDSNYLTRGLALYSSLEKSGEPFSLIVFCFDDLTRETLEKLGLKHAQLVSLKEFENEDLLRIKPTRTPVEYCWTCTPQIILYSLEKFQLREVTYVDADLFFYHSPSLLLDEFHRSSGSILLTEHRYTPKYDRTETSGIYCVQFMTFKSDPRGMNALNWWKDRCLEWCFAKAEDGKLGDQKYLDDWTDRFEGVHVLEHLGGGVAPWNVQQYQIDSSDPNQPRVNSAPLVFYHFHGLVWFESGSFDLSQYELEPKVIEALYHPYVRALEKGLHQVRAFWPDFSRGMQPDPQGAKHLWRKWKRKRSGTYHWMDPRLLNH